MSLPIVFENLSPQEIRDFINEVEAACSASTEKIDIPVKHHFSKDVYGREIFIPKESFIVGKIHKHENMNFLIKGELTVVSIEGVKRVTAPFIVISPPGVKRLAYAHEDSVWVTVHGTSETDVEKIEEEFIVKSYDELIERKETKWLGLP